MDLIWNEDAADADVGSASGREYFPEPFAHFAVKSDRRSVCLRSHVFSTGRDTTGYSRLPLA